MKRTLINIDRLELRLRGVSRQKAQLILPELRPALVAEFAQLPNLARKHDVLDKRSMELGILQVSPQVKPSALANLIAGRIAETITAESN